MKDYHTWIKPGLDQQSLTVFNFGYERALPFPSIALTPDRKSRFNLQTSGTQTQSSLTPGGTTIIFANTNQKQPQD